MLRQLVRPTIAAACGLAVCFCATTTLGHFLWLKTIRLDEKPHAFLFFGENPQDEAYHLPEALADAKVWCRTIGGERSELEMRELDSDERIGLAVALPDSRACVLEATEQYGVYGTALLVYSAKHVQAGSADQFNSSGTSKELPLEIVPRIVGDEVQLTVLWEGKPLAGAEASIAVADAEAVKRKTDDQGRLTFAPQGKGTVSVLANRTDKDLSGELKGKRYDHGLHYSSLTFNWPVTGQKEANDRPAADGQTALPPLPEPLSSFGAAVADGWLYVYGGHTGTEHEHSAANLSKHFRRIRLNGNHPAGRPPEWQDLPMQTPLQGLALVAYGPKVYRIGGMNARNATINEEEDLHSTAEFAEFDPHAGRWTSLEPLPAPRSSHNAVVIGDRLYVVGGWALSGSSPGEWQQDTLVYDFSDPSAGWQALAKPPFKRRALSASHWDGKLVAIGGLDDQGEVAQQVDLFDPESRIWNEGPKLPGDGHAGFGVAAWNLGGRLYASGLNGILFRLSDDGSQWQEAGRLQKPRFFHQLVPSVDGKALLAIGGASRGGHIADIEWLDISE